MKKLILLTLLFSGCVKDGLSEQHTNNKEFDVELLFEHDTCKVFRFYDGGRSRYFTNCKGETMTTHSCGKNCTFEENIKGGK